MKTNRKPKLSDKTLVSLARKLGMQHVPLRGGNVQITKPQSPTAKLAPELLKALQKTLSLAEAYVAHNPSDMGNKTLRIARKAIKKATT